MHTLYTPIATIVAHFATVCENMQCLQRTIYAYVVTFWGFLARKYYYFQELSCIFTLFPYHTCLDM